VEIIKRIARAGLPGPARRRLLRARDSIGERAPLIPRLVRRYCTGSGIEIGAGKDPYGSPANTVFLDRHTDNAQGTAGAGIVADAAAIPRPDATFDFVLSSHCLEHHQNTLKALNEWLRVLKPGGILFLVLPHADRTFDRHRQKTTLEHHIRDYETLGEDLDRSHVEEAEAGMRRLADLAEWERRHEEVWGAGFWDWEHRFRNDAFHFHVWTQDEIVRLLHYLGLAIAFVEERVPERYDSFVVVARKPG
jgi:SAM-dependent methyltransferase